MIRRFVAIWASCLAAPVDLDAVKRRVQESTMRRDLGILFEGSVDLDVVKKEGASIDDLSRFGHRVWRLCRPTRFCNRRIFNEFPMKINDFAAFFVPSTYVER